MKKEKKYWIASMVVTLVIILGLLFYSPFLAGWMGPEQFYLNYTIFWIAIISLVGLALKKKFGFYGLAIALVLLFLGLLVVIPASLIGIAQQGQARIVAGNEGIHEVEFTPFHLIKLQVSIPFLIIAVLGLFIVFKTGKLEKLSNFIKKIGKMKFLAIAIVFSLAVVFYFNLSEIAILLAYQGNASLCQFSVNPSGCASAAALISDDYSKCYQLSGEARSECLFWYAVPNGEWELCKEITNTEKEHLRDICYARIAGITDNEELCQMVENPEIKNECPIKDY